MTAETLSSQMNNSIFSLKPVAVLIKSMINGSQDFSQKILDVKKSSVCIVRHIAAMTTNQKNSNSVVKF